MAARRQWLPRDAGARLPWPPEPGEDHQVGEMQRADDQEHFADHQQPVHGLDEAVVTAEDIQQERLAAAGHGKANEDRDPDVMLNTFN